MRANYIQFVTNMAIVTSLLFLPSYMEVTLGASEAFVGATASLTALATFLASYLFGRWADIRGRRIFLLLGLGSSGLAATFQFLALDPWTMLLTRILLGLCIGVYPSALMVQAHDQKLALGNFASWGSLGWGVGAVAAAVASLFITEQGRIRETFLLSAVMFAGAFALALRMEVAAGARLSIPRFPRTLVRRNLGIYGPILIRHTGANMIWVIFPLYLEEDLHIDKFGIGVLYAINSLVQFLTMQVVQAWAPRRLFILGLGLSGLTFFAFTQARGFWGMVPTQVVLGISWATMYVGALELVFQRNLEKATSLGLLGSSIAVAAAIGPFLGGLLSDSFGRSRVVPMYAAAALAVVALVLFYRMEPHGELVAPGPTGALASVEVPRR